MPKPIKMDTRISEAGRRLTAAELILRGRMDEFFASLMVGCETQRATVRDGVIASFESVLDAHDYLAWLQLEKDGINPQRRHVQ